MARPDPPFAFFEDLELARRVAAGDEGAFDAFFREYFPRLYRFAEARTGGAADVAEDVVQETLIAALRHAGQYRGEAALFSWLCTICRRILARRALPVEAAVSAAAPDLESLPSGLPPAEDGVARAELRLLVHAALDALPERYARALEWKYLEELGVRDIAAQLGIAPKAAESLLTRARAAFRDAFCAVRGTVPEGTRP